MKKLSLSKTLPALFRAAVAAAVALLPIASYAGPFTADNLVVSRIGNGSASLNNAAHPISLVELTSAGANPAGGSNIIALPSFSSGGNNQGGFTDSGSATSNGTLNLSVDGQYLATLGIDAQLGTGSVTGTSAATANRNVGRIDATGTISVRARLTDAFSGDNARAVCTDTGAVFYATGNASSGPNAGVRYIDATSSVATTSTQIVSGNLRNVILAKDNNGNKVLVQASTSVISYHAGVPTAAATPTAFTFTTGGMSSGSGAMVFFDRNAGTNATGLNGLDTLYLVDGATIEKYEWTGSGWTQRGSTTTTGGNLFGLAARIVGSNVELYATRELASNNGLYKLTDASGFGGTLSGTPTLIASAGTNFGFRGVAFAPTAASTITTTGTLAAVDTTYGAASASPTSFSVSGASLTGDLTVAAPAGFEVSTTIGSGYATSLNLTQSGGAVSATTIYVRLAAATAAGTHSGNVVVSGGGASPKNVATAPSVVSPASLTITGVTADGKPYDGNTTTTLSGTPAYVGLQNGESFAVTGTAAANFDTAAAGMNKPVTVTGYTAPTTNYTASQPTGLTANVSTVDLTITANDVVKPQGNTLTGGTSYTGFTSLGLVNSEAIESVTVSYGAGAAAGDLAANYPDSVTISDATGGTFTPSNYEITYVPGDITVTAGPSISLGGTPTALTFVYGNAIAGTPTSFTAGGANLTGDLTVTAPSGFHVSLSSATGFGSSVNLTATSGTVATTTIYVRLAELNTVGDYSGNVSVSGGGATTQNIAIPLSAVTTKELTITGIAGVNKEYTRTNDATLSGTPALVGVVGSDDVSVSGTPSATFNNVLVGTAKPITVSGYTLAGTSAFNYTLAQPAGLTADITTKALTVTGAAVTARAYDGTTNATITGTLDGVIAPDVVTFVGTGTFASAGPGAGIAVTSTSTLAGADAGNYSLTQPIGLTGDITASTNADLSSLVLSTGAFSPAFGAAQLNYVELVDNATTSLTVTPTTASAVATVTVNTVPVTSGSPTDAISLNEGINAIAVAVTAQDGTTIKTYTITVIRQSTAVLGPGSIAFTGFNADGNDNLAFVALTTIPANTVIFFADEEWTGTDWFAVTECCFAWVPSSTVVAGTVVTMNDLSNIYSGVPAAAANLGTLVPMRDTNNGAGLGNSDEAIYAFQSTGTLNAGSMVLPSAFLAFITNEDVAPVDNPYTLTNTGLSEAAGTAVIFAADDDGMRYKGARSGLASFADYLPLIGNESANWDTVGGGDGTTYLPFNTTAFTLAAAAPVVSITAEDAIATELGTNTGTFRFSRTGSTDNALTVSYSIASGAGYAISADYTESLTGSVIIPIGASFVDLAITPVKDLVLEGDETVQLTVTDTVDYDLGSPTAVSVTIVDAETAVDLSRYVRVGRFSLPHPSVVSAPANNDLSEEASGVTYNWDSDTLFTIGDTGTSVTEVTKTGGYVSTMTLQGFGDPEGITYIGGGQFVFTDERVREVVKFTYVAGGTLLPGAAQIVKLGTTIGNIGLEGLTYDPQTSGFIVVKEADPQGIFQTTVDFGAGTASNGSPTTENSINLFAPGLVSLEDMSDVFAFSNLPALTGHPNTGHLLILSQESGMVRHVDRTGNVLSTMTLVADAGNPLTIQNQTQEGITMDRQGNIYIVSENGGGDILHPELWVFAPSNAINTAPTAVALSSSSTTIPDSTSTANPLKMATIVVTDADGVGVNNFSVSGPDAADFTFIGSGLYLKAGTVLNGGTKPTYNVIVNVDDSTVGGNPDASTGFTLNVTGTGGGGGTIRVTEVAPWSSGNSPVVVADWFELTNTGSSAVNITGWKMTDSNAGGFSTAGPITGITSIAAGESVIFVDAGRTAEFITNWFGTNPGIQVGTYNGPGLGTGGDAVAIYDGAGNLQARVDFGASPTVPGPFGSFDNSAGLNNVTLTQLSVVGVNGAFTAAATTSEIGSPGTAVVTSNPLVSITATDANAAEAGTNPGTFRIARTGSTVTSMQVIFTIATGAGHAVAADYTPTLASPALIPAGESFVDITITPVDDADVEGSETVTLTLGDAGSYDVGSPASATVTIADNDVPNTAPSVALINTVPAILENTSTASPVRVADISITDDGVGTNDLSLSGADLAAFEISGGSLYLKAGTSLNYFTKPSYAVTVNVNDTAVGTDPDSSVNFTLTIKQFVAPGTIIVSEVSPWSSTAANSPLAADWIEITNIGSTAANIAGWKIDDDSNSFGNALVLNGVTTIGAGESVIFIETNNLSAAATTFRNLWFGASPPAGLQIGNYTGSGIGLGNGGDSVNVFTAGGDRVTGIAVGASPSAPFKTFDNAAGAGSTTLPLPLVNTLSAIGVNGAFAAANDANEIGSPGKISDGPAPAVYQVESATYSVSETAGSLIVNVTRTGGTSAADITFTTTNGSAAAGTDFTAPTNPVHFTAGAVSAAVTIPITDRSGSVQGNRNFSAAITAVPEGSSIGAVSSTAITITEPAGSLTVPATLTVHPVNPQGLPNTIALVISRGNDAGGAVDVTVSASAPTSLPSGMLPLNNVKDYTFAGDTTTVSFANGEATKTLNIPLKSSVRVGRVLFTLSAPTGDAVLGSPAQTLVEVPKKDTVAPVLNVTFGTPNAGLVGITGTATDTGGVNSGLNRLELTAVNVRGTSVSTLTVGAGGAFGEDFQLQHGVNKLTVTAYDNSGKKTARSTSITFTNPDITALGGKTYTGLLVPNTPHVAASNDNSGLLTVTVSASTAVSGKLTVGGIAMGFTGGLDNDGAVRFKPTGAAAIDVIDKKEFDSFLGSLSVTISPGVAVGTLKAQAGGLHLGVANAKQQATAATASLVNGSASQKYTVALPSQVQAGLTAEEYPQGDGFASVTVSPNGSVSVSGFLADGAAYSASGKLHVATATTQAVSLHKNLYRARGSFALELVFDLNTATNGDSDMLGADALWVRPAQPRARYYKAGWPAGALVDAIGAKYTVPSAGSVLPGLSSGSPNAELQFQDGELPSLATRNLDITATNGFINKSSDAALKLSIAKGTGLFKGIFTHSDATKPAFQGIILQEGANAKGFGYFLSTPALSYDGQGESGGVTLAPKQ